MKRGWCPTVHAPMQTGDGLLVRVKPSLGRLSAVQAHLVADEAARCGNGIIELTGRGNLQIRGLTSASVGRFAGAMVAADLASGDAAVERRRNVMVSPLAGADPMVAADTLTLAQGLEARLAQDRALDGLPPKFTFAIDGGGMLPLSVSADVTLWTDGAGCRVNGRPGAAPLETAIAQARAAVPERRTVPGLQPAAMAGFVCYSGSQDGAFALGLPFGQMDASTLAALADVSRTFSDGMLRVSPWRALLLGTVRSADLAALAQAASRLGLIVDPADRRLFIAACIGAAGCASGTVRARDDAAALAALGWQGAGSGAVVHVAGCTKGCAHPGPARRTLVGEAGRYNLVREGRAADPPSATGLTLAQAAAL